MLGYNLSKATGSNYNLEIWYLNYSKAKNKMFPARTDDNGFKIIKIFTFTHSKEINCHHVHTISILLLKC